MTVKQTIIEHLHAADKELRKAMVLAGGMVLKGQLSMNLVTNDIQESEWYLDEALAHTQAHAKAVDEKKSKKNLTSVGECVKV
jgi:bifunctional N-acetylglucosamine-1-phosphate-uridyltransferase/glucosamine-1-phosphate-acetyltransferase GlmU-like protein